MVVVNLILLVTLVKSAITEKREENSAKAGNDKVGGD